MTWNGRQHFFCTAARAMRDILVDAARRKGAQKRGGGWRRVDLGAVEDEDGASFADLIVLDLVLQKLEREHEDKYQIVMLRYFAGLSVPEVAEVLDLSRATVQRRRRFCRSWLSRELDAQRQGDNDPA